MARKALAWLLTAVMALLILLNIGLTLMEREVPLYHLDSANLTDWVEMPPMSEEVLCKDGKVYVLFESACTKYIYGNLIRGTYVYAYG